MTGTGAVIRLGLLALAPLLLPGCRQILVGGEAIGDCYVRDESGIEIRYFGGYPSAKRVRIAVKGANPTRFRLLADSRKGNCAHEALYGADDQGVYYRQHRLDNANPETFQVFGGGYGGDDRTLYYREARVQGGSPAGFRVVPIPHVDAYYGISPSQVFYRGKPIAATVDPGTFSALGGEWVRDAKAVYLRRRPDPIEGADPTSFRLLALPKRKTMRQPYAKDARWVYLVGEHGVETLPGADPASFELLNQHYARDRNQVYYHGVVIEGADAATFQVESRAFAHSASDHLRRYHMGKPREP